MRIPRWLLMDFTDSHFDLTREQKREIKRRARRLRSAHRTNFTTGFDHSSDAAPRPVHRETQLSRLAWSFALIVVPVAWFLLIVLSPRQFVGRPFLAVVAVLLLLASAMWVSTAVVYSRLWKPWYRRAMYELGYAICAECGYPFIGIEESPRCPECGWRKAHRNDPPPVEWTEDDRETLRAHGYEACTNCGGILLAKDATCPRCGEERP